MKEVLKDKIVQIDDTLYDSKFLFWILFPDFKSADFEVIFMKDRLQEKKNNELLEKIKKHPAMWSEVFSPKDELQIFTDIYDDALKSWKKVHIVWITLYEEIKMLEDYYVQLWFFREDINCFLVDFSKVQISASVNMFNLMWRWSDYKRMWEKIFTCPPIRESWQVKSLFTWINRGVVSWVVMDTFTQEEKNFLDLVLREEQILPLTLSKVLNYNFQDFGFSWKKQDYTFNY